MTTRVPWGGYRADARVEFKPPYFSWASVPWLGIATLKVWPFRLIFNWPVTFDDEPDHSE